MRKRIPLGDLFNEAIGAGANIYATHLPSAAAIELPQSGTLEVSGAFSAAGNVSMIVTRGAASTPPILVDAVTADEFFRIQFRGAKGDTVELQHSVGGTIRLLSTDLLTD